MSEVEIEKVMGADLNNGDAKWHKFQGVQVFARRDGLGKPTKVDAIDDDKGKIEALGDLLQRSGYGVMREKSPRAGRVFHRLYGVWIGPGDPPENPFGQD